MLFPPEKSMDSRNENRLLLRLGFSKAHIPVIF